MTQTLDQLSAAATEGEWSISGLEQSTQIWAETYVGETRDYDGNDADFIVALVNAYRTGHLVAVQADEQRCPNCAVKFHEIVDVDAHISALAAKGTGDE